MTIEKLYQLCTNFFKRAQEELDQDKIDKHSFFITDYYMRVPVTHEKYEKFLNKMIEILGQPEGQEAFNIAFGVGLEHPDMFDGAKDLVTKATQLLPHLNPTNREIVLRFVPKENLKNYIGDEDQNVKATVFTRLDVDDVDTLLFQLKREPTKNRSFMGDAMVGNALKKLVNILPAERIMEVVPYLRTADDELAYANLWKQYVSALSDDDARALLSMDIPSYYKDIVNYRWMKKQKQPEDMTAEEKAKTREQAKSVLNQMNLMFGKQDKKLN